MEGRDGEEIENREDKEDNTGDKRMTGKREKRGEKGV